MDKTIVYYISYKISNEDGPTYLSCLHNTIYYVYVTQVKVARYLSKNSTNSKKGSSDRKRVALNL